MSIAVYGGRLVKFSEYYSFSATDGSDILQEIPLDKISFNYDNIPQKPSDSVMRVIQKYVDSALDKIKETLYEIRDTVWNAFEKIAIISKKENRPEVESIRDSLDNAITDMTEVLTDDTELIMNKTAMMII